ncbi:MAG TPA: ABC transporter ATP-binding protein [Hypericibacter adhaerens]|uniref:ABC transporter ATP-binding protein n=1 Tax=Hypericibacter adhaerens TaxID=2602016 RepID=UPI002BFABF08|nr:ABC transporter ATP-binding protein [Hypericibacter adhaerens]HWA42833.1 ABC transporter ATP-binding protein [Hypericibacter adhaerens]
MSALQIQGLTKRFDKVTALADIGFEVAEGEFLCVVGPTNAGKSTLLKTIAGLIRPDRGRILAKGRDLADVAPKDRGVSLLFQNIALFPTMTGFENIAFPLTAAGETGASVEARVRQTAELLRVGHVLNRYPRTFSGGEQQRVAIGRAIIRPSDLLLLDEPLSNLDARIRIALRIEFKKLHRERRQTILYVTHDQTEAMSLSDRIVVLNEGRIQQIGRPQEIYDRPANRFVARFIGTPPMNILDAEVTSEGGAPILAGAGFRVPLRNLDPAITTLPRQVGLGLRAEEIRVAPAESRDTPFPAEIVWAEHLGPKTILDLRLGSTVLKAVVADDHAVKGEGRAWLGFTPKPHHLLNRETDQFLR